MNETKTDSDTQAGAAANPRGALARLERRLVEAYLELGDRYVDPREALLDDDGSRWLELGAGATASTVVANEQELARVRRECRGLAATNEFAINGHENRVSYIVGAGHAYRATLKKGAAAPVGLAADTQRVLEDFLRDAKWQQRQQEIVRRRDRDGEAFLRFFTAPEGRLRLRFVEPSEVATPAARAVDAAASFGVLTDRQDVETPLAYYVGSEIVPADEIQHRKANVDRNVKRGLPLYYPVRKNLRRAEKLLRNMSVVSEIQSAIALIRRHASATRASVQRFVSDQADAAVTRGGRTTTFKQFGPGTILDAYGGLEYDFPTAGLDASRYVTVLQAELRAIASRLVMPEFMLTSDASNANYASTMVAEGPAVRMFARLQAEQIEDDLEVMWRAVRCAVDAGKLPNEALVAIEIQASPPSLAVRHPLEEAQVAEIQTRGGILSPQTWSLRSGLDYDQEQENLRGHAGRGD
ncbi:MAG: phage portal protein [Pirellulales bacterium]|nr:phage portal protein [Pirellulales bacterium]